MSYLERFGLSHRPLPRDASGKTFYDQGEDFARIARIFHWLSDEPGLGVLVGDPGTGKTTCIRHLCAHPPRPRYRVTAASRPSSTRPSPCESSRPVTSTPASTGSPSSP